MITAQLRRDSLPIGLVVVFGSIALGLVGPFGQIDRFATSERIGLWLLYLSAGLPVALLVNTYIRDRLRSVPFAIVCAYSALALCLPLLLWVEIIGLFEGRPFPDTIGDWAWSSGEVAVITAVLLVLMGQRSDANAHAGAEVASDLARLEEIIGVDPGTMQGFCAEGHYTRVHFAEGSHFVRAPFSEMVLLSASLDGIQTHRSWWVRRSCISEMHRKGSAGEVILANGTPAPVARRRLAEVRAQARLSQNRRRA